MSVVFRPKPRELLTIPIVVLPQETSLTKGGDDPVSPFNVARQEHLGRRLTLLANTLYMGRVVT